MNKNLIKNIWAVLAGFLFVFIVSIATDILFSVIGVFPRMDQPELFTSWMYVLVLIYSSIYTVVGGYITARLSAAKPMRQVYILAVLGFVSGALGAYGNWDKSVGNEWFPVLLAVTGPIFVYLGGRLFLRK